jgi:hypothetical protein
VTLSVDRLDPVGRSTRPLQTRRVRPAHCTWCREVVDRTKQLLTGDLTYCSEACLIAHGDHLAAQDDRGWEPSVSPGWAAAPVVSPWARIAECPACGADMGSPDCCGQPSGRPTTEGTR